MLPFYPTIQQTCCRLLFIVIYILFGSFYLLYAVKEYKKYREHLTHNWLVNPDNIQHRLLTRFTPDDLMAVVRVADPREPLSFNCDLHTAYNTLDELANNKEWRHLSRAIPMVARSRKEMELTYPKLVYKAFEECLRRAARSTFYQRKDLLCSRHLRRFRGWNHADISYSGCPVCGQTQFGIEVKDVSLVLDRRLAWTTRYQGHTLRVNRFRIDHLVDFDHIEIGACMPQDIVAFCIQVGNEPDEYLAAHISGAPYWLLKGHIFDEEARVAMSRFFVPGRQDISES